jgi:hypothetical protein
MNTLKMNRTQIDEAACAIVCDDRARKLVTQGQLNCLNEIVLSLSASDERIKQLWEAASIDDVKLDELKAVVNR